MNWKVCVAISIFMYCIGLQATDVIVGTSNFTIKYPFSHQYGYVRSAALYTEAELVYIGQIRSLSWLFCFHKLASV
jgi:hypothetical protein